MLQELHSEHIARRQRLWRPANAVRDPGINLPRPVFLKSRDIPKRPEPPLRDIIARLTRLPEPPAPEPELIETDEPDTAPEPSGPIQLELIEGLPPIPDPVADPDFPPAPKYPKLWEIMNAVCARYKIKRDHLLSKRRTLDIVRPRQIAMYLAKTLTIQSFPEIGRRMGGRDHTTVLHGMRRIEELRAIDPDLDAIITELEGQLRK